MYRFSFQIHRHVILSTNTLSSSPFFSAGDKNTDDKKSIVKAFGIYNTLDSVLYVIVTDAMCAKGVTFVG